MYSKLQNLAVAAFAPMIVCVIAFLFFQFDLPNLANAVLYNLLAGINFSIRSAWFMPKFYGSFVNSPIEKSENSKDSILWFVIFLALLMFDYFYKMVSNIQFLIPIFIIIQSFYVSAKILNSKD